MYGLPQTLVMRTGLWPDGGARWVIIVLVIDEAHDHALDKIDGGLGWKGILFYNLIAGLMLEFIIVFMR
jgi:hypothetical protein